MQYINLLASFGNTTDLDLFASTFFSVIGVSKIEKRESANYIEGCCFKGKCGDVSYTVSISDEWGHEDLPFWIQISEDTSDLETLVAVINRNIQKKALPAGFNFARMVNFGKKDEKRIDY